MPRRLLSLLIRTCLAFTLAVPLAAQFEAAAVVRYTAEEIDPVFRPTAINNRGWIVGWGRGNWAMRYRPGVGLELLSNLHGMLSDINDAGTAIGGLWWHDRGWEAIIRPAGAPWKRIETLPGAGVPQLYSINNAGQVVGTVYYPSGEPRPFIYTEAEGIKMLFDLRAGASHINELGQVTGSLWTSASGDETFLWDRTQGLININAQPGVCKGFEGPYGLAADGTIVGACPGGRPDTLKLATFSLTSGLRVIGEPKSWIAPRAVNGRGWIVGEFGDEDRPGRAFLYVYGQGIRDLNSLLTNPLGAPLVAVSAINDRDEILAFGGSRWYVLRRVR